ncbi:MAG: hypothetical protein QGI79_07130 [Dehalococcoidia bacterium]|nr:hypothetical protein [Dehalococcoidia bacterium]
MGAGVGAGVVSGPPQAAIISTSPKATDINTLNNRMALPPSVD